MSDQRRHIQPPTPRPTGAFGRGQLSIPPPTGSFRWGAHLIPTYGRLPPSYRPNEPVQFNDNVENIEPRIETTSREMGSSVNDQSQISQRSFPGSAQRQSSSGELGGVFDDLELKKRRMGSPQNEENKEPGYRVRQYPGLAQRQSSLSLREQGSMIGAYTPPPDLSQTPKELTEEQKRAIRLKYPITFAPPANVDPEYVKYSAKKRQTAPKTQQISAFDTYNPFSTQGKPIPHSAPTSLAQSQTGYTPLHPSEEFLPMDDEGRRAVYGTWEGHPIQGPSDWDQYFRDWPDIGEQYKEPILSYEALDPKEIDFCLKYGIEFEKELGRGAFGTVWLVNTTKVFTESKPDPKYPGQFIHSHITKKVACKVSSLKRFTLKQEPLDVAVEKLVREADLQKQLNHKNIIKCEHIFNIHDPETGFPYCRLLMFMELCDGDVGTLIRNAPKKRLKESQGKDVLRDVSAGLKYLHDQNICHLDIKVHNIMYINKKGKFCYKLGDFGLSKQYQCESAAKFRGIIGTRKYFAPETTTGSNEFVNSKPVDIYALGCALAETVVGKDDWADCVKAFQLSSGDPKDFANNLSIYKISAPFAQLLIQMTTKKPKKRITIANVCSDPWLSVAPTPSKTTSPSKKTSPSKTTTSSK